MTIFNTPVLTAFLRAITCVLAWIGGWRFINLLDNVPRKCVIIAVPHTSNWDFFVFLGAVFYFRISAGALMKTELFRWPLAPIFRYCGGVPIDRQRKNAQVRDVAKHFAARDELRLVITPEGTRRAVEKWKSGFHHIARLADVPLVLARMDAERKLIYLQEIFPLSDDFEADYRKIREKFKDAHGLRPENYIR